MGRRIVLYARVFFCTSFEKMLYDQAQLAIAYLTAYQITSDPLLADVSIEAESGFFHRMKNNFGELLFTHRWPKTF